MPFNFDPASVEIPKSNFDLLPAGQYTVEIIEAEVKPFKKGTGEGLFLTYEVIDPYEHAQRKIWQTITTQHGNDQAVDIGKQSLAKLCIACKIDKLTSEDQFFQKMLRIKIKHKVRDGQTRIDVVDYSQAGVPTTPSAPSTQKPALTSARPWAKA